MTPRNAVERGAPTSSLRTTGLRTTGDVSLRVERMGARTRISNLAESGSARLRVPRTEGDPLEAVLINTAGGIVAGDHFRVDLSVGRGAALVATTAAAEKAYRSTGATSTIDTSLVVEAGGVVEWLPQETILFDRARLRRRLTVALDATAAATLFEAIVFGRAASAETVRSGAIEDRWQVRRGGRLVYADTLRMEGPLADLLARPAIANGARALATLLHVAPNADSRLEEARAWLAETTCECGASAWGGQLLVRWLAPDIETLRANAARFMLRFRGRPLPRVWHL